MATAPIIFDVTRLVTRLGRLTPNGIDRVDLAYAHYLADGPFDVLTAIIGPDGTARLAPRHALVKITSAINAAWAEESDASSATHPAPEERRERARRRSGGFAEFARLTGGWARLQMAGALVGSGGICPGRSLVTGAPRDAVYLNVSQFPIWRPSYLAALERRPDVRCYFLIHDLLPIRYPEFFRPFEVRRHIGRLDTMTKRASGVIVSSEPNRRDLLAYYCERQLCAPDIIVAPLPIAPAFRAKPKDVARAIDAPPPYFVCVGTIEPRKNHLFLLQVWRDLITRLGSSAPDLILVGSKGWQCENVLDMLERCPSLRGRVRLVSGLSTPALVTLLRSATALLMPTFAEGYGLPVAEALQSGVPVIASDIEAFREADEPQLTRVDAIDGLGWSRAIADHLRGPLAVGSTPGQSTGLCRTGHIGAVIHQIATRGVDTPPPVC